MIYLFAGEDTKSKLKHYEKFYSSLSGRSEIFSFSRNDFDKMQVESLCSGTGLFSSKSVIIFSGIMEHEETRDFATRRLDLMAKSQNIFIFLEGKLNKAASDAFKKSASLNKKGVEIREFPLQKLRAEKFNNFLLANAFEKKDKLNLWIYFRQAISKDATLEELTGILFWKIKDTIIKKDFRKFSLVELTKLASRLSFLLPEARQQGRDAELALEQFLLEAF